MFVKGKEKRTLERNFLEAIKVEKDLASISSHQGNEESKPSLIEKSIKNNKKKSKLDSEKKDNEPTNMEIIQRVIKHLTNEIIDLKKIKGEGKKAFKPFLKKRIDFAPEIPPTLGINLEYYAMKNHCRTHHVNH